VRCRLESERNEESRNESASTINVDVFGTHVEVFDCTFGQELAGILDDVARRASTSLACRPRSRSAGPAPVAFMIGSTLCGMLFAGLGGYVAARLAGRRPLAHAAALALVIALGAGISIVTSARGDDVWSQVAAMFLMAPSAILGGFVRRS
jgi:hypothetical protein